MKYDYYLHRSRGFVDDYFGEIGEPVKVSPVVYYLAWLTKRRRTKVTRGSTTDDVKTQAAINTGAHPTSHFVKKQRSDYKPEPALAYRSVW